MSVFVGPLLLTFNFKASSRRDRCLQEDICTMTLEPFGCADVSQAQKDCRHPDFLVAAVINRVPATDGSREMSYQLDLGVRCSDCGLPFRFLGLPAGVDLNGAAVSINGEEGRFAIAPRGRVAVQFEGHCAGFTVRKPT